MASTQTGDADWGGRDARGEWRPPEGVGRVPLFVWPPQPAAFFHWIFSTNGYFVPWYAFFGAVILVQYFFFLPAIDRMATLSVDWIAELYVQNLVMLVAYTGGLQLWLYRLRLQGTRFKYNGKWPNYRNKAFLFSNQLADNVFWSVVGGCTVWTAYEALMLWAGARHLLPSPSWSHNAAYFVVVLLLIPVWQVLHFYLTHRLIHFKWLYRHVHYLHHKNVNIGPWSGLAMHPVEHVIFFSAVLIFLIVPSSPFHIVFIMVRLGLQPAQGHAGFHEFEMGPAGAVHNDSYYHYLHHRYHTVNFGDDIIPLDRWFGTLHDGSEAAQAAMRKRSRAAIEADVK